MTCYDIIGDVHGQADKLEALLLHLGYQAIGKSYRAPAGRQLVLLGDLIDRGPKQLRVLEIARSMVESGEALCIMGNHELNAIGFVTPRSDQPYDFYRPNSPAKRAQHSAFLEQIGEGSAQHQAAVEWFRTLPAFLDLDGIRVVHGCWDQMAVDTLTAGGWGPGVHLSEGLLAAVYETNPDGTESPMMRARKLLTCGLELDLPPGRAIRDTAGHEHKNVRIANWRHWAREFHELALVSPGQEEQLRDMQWPADLVITRIEGAPVFVGHHWFSGYPQIESPKLACLDWSAARDGLLVAYRWDGESDLANEKLTWVGKAP